MHYFGASEWRRLGQCASLPQQEVKEIAHANTFYLNTHYIVCLGSREIEEGERQLYDTALEGIMQLREGLRPDYTLAEEYSFIEAVFRKINALAQSLESNVQGEWHKYRSTYSTYLERLKLESEQQNLSAQDQQTIAAAQEGIGKATGEFTFSWYEDPKIILPVVFGMLAIGAMITYNRQRRG